MFQLKKHFLWSFYHNPDSQKVPGKFKIIVLFRLSKSTLSVTMVWCLIPPTRVSIDYLLFGGYSIRKFFVSIQVSSSWQSKDFKKWYSFWFRSFFKNFIILNHHQFSLLHEKRNRKHSTFRWYSNQFIRVFFSFISILIVWNFLRKRFNFSFAR